MQYLLAACTGYDNVHAGQVDLPNRGSQPISHRLIPKRFACTQGLWDQTHMLCLSTRNSAHFGVVGLASEFVQVLLCLVRDITHIGEHTVWRNSKFSMWVNVAKAWTPGCPLRAANACQNPWVSLPFLLPLPNHVGLFSGERTRCTGI